jgi:quinoprotein glucose dehydrogenase
MRRTTITSLAVIALTALCFGPLSQAAGKDGDWANTNRVLNGDRYSPLNQVNRDNVTKLVQVWTHPSGTQAVPTVVNGVMYLAFDRYVAAVNATDGKEIWRHEVNERMLTRRGVSYWPGDQGHKPRILFTANTKLLALDAATGAAISSFGKGGVVDVVVGYSSAPTIYRNVAIIGAQTSEVPIGVPGNTRAYDVITGDKVWEFHNVPLPGEVGHTSWIKGWEGRSGTNVWDFAMTVDKARGILYMPIGGPAANYWGGDRPGNGLFGNSVVAVDALTGKYIWHFQTVHHGLWDSDQPHPPVLIDIKKDGKIIPSLAISSKTSFMYILNRYTGKPIFGVKETPVPKGDVPGEWYSPTQPIPVKPPPLSRVSFKPEDIVTAEDTTPEHAKACRALYERSGGFYNAGPFTPFMFHKAGDPPKSTIQFPGGIGGINWGGLAADPNTNYVYANAHDTSLVGWVEKRVPGKKYESFGPENMLPYDRASVDGGGPYFSFNAPVEPGSRIRLPCQKPPWAHLVAVNANTGDIAWETVLGIEESLPKGKQKVGGAGSAGPTVTAGGLVFIGATNDKYFRAFDSSTGKELWRTRLKDVGNANPMTYLGKDGKQYVAIVAGRDVVVFALPAAGS